MTIRFDLTRAQEAHDLVVFGLIDAVLGMLVLGLALVALLKYLMRGD